MNLLLKQSGRSKPISDRGDFAMLKKIEAIIREDKVNDVKDALEKSVSWG